ncbi:alcohol dehydrogenase catalytic domain-containing protein [Streptomyces sirii]|uniref:alcohol dehydrogenase catalytic domain-containing protein n=1 Tax=Streptomyces sirii TaxID=3127701 RepID=UPI003D36DA23
MRAMRFERFGGSEVLAEAEVPDPVAGPGETLVEVAAAGVNFGDIKQIAGEHTDGPYAPKGPLPRIPGLEVVGRTPDGRRVLGCLPQGDTPRRRWSPTATWSRCRRGCARARRWPCSCRG